MTKERNEFDEEDCESPGDISDFEDFDPGYISYSSYRDRGNAHGVLVELGMDGLGYKERYEST